MTWRVFGLIGSLSFRENPTTTSGRGERRGEEKRAPRREPDRREGLIQEWLRSEKRFARPLRGRKAYIGRSGRSGARSLRPHCPARDRSPPTGRGARRNDRPELGTQMSRGAGASDPSGHRGSGLTAGASASACWKVSRARPLTSSPAILIAPLCSAPPTMWPP